MIENSNSSFSSSPRIQSLAKPKRILCAMPRSSYSIVPSDVLKYNATDRILTLSLPKVKKDNHVKTEFSRFAYDPTNSCVFNKAALKADCPEHVNNLAKPKGDYKGYKFAFPVERSVTKSAKNATATERLLTLSIPKIRKDNN